MDRRYHNLRRKLDQHGYKQYFDIESIDLVDKLLIDLLQSKHNRFGHSSGSSNGFVKENVELQKELERFKKEYENRFKALNDKIRKLENESSNIKLLNNQYSTKIEQLEDESQKKSDRLQELFEKNLHATIQISGNKPEFKNQQLEIDSLVPPSFANQQSSTTRSKPDQHYIDLLKVTEDQVARLRLEKDALKNELESANALIVSLKVEMDSKGVGKDKLSKILRNDHSARHEHPCNDHLVAHLTFEMDHLQRLNYELEKRLKDVINSEKEMQSNEHRYLFTQNKQLEKNLSDVSKESEALKQQKEKLLSVTDKEMNEAKEEMKLLYSKIQNLENDIAHLKKENESLSLGKNECMTSLSAANAQVKSLEAIVKQSEEVNHRSQKSAQISKDDEVINKDLNSLDHYLSIITSLEKQREFYKQQLENLSNRTQHQKKSAEQLTTSTPFIKNGCLIADDTIHIQWNPLITLLEEERDAYKTQCTNLRKAGSHLSEEAGGKPNLTELKTQLQNVTEENKELNKTLESLEKHIQEVNVSAEELTSEKIALQKLYDRVLAAHQQQKEKVGQKGPMLPEIIAKYQAERDKAVADQQRAVIELEVLRNKLKLATETQISERKRLEDKISDLESRMLTGVERADLLAKITSTEVELFNLNEENRLLKRRTAELEAKLIEEKAKSDRLAREVVEKSEKTLKDTERILIQKDSERSLVVNKVADLEKQIEELTDVIERRNSEINQLKMSMMILDRDKDKFQAEIDEKTERVISLNDSLNSKVKDIMDLKLNLATLERRLDQMADEVIQKEREISNLKRETEHSRREMQNARNATDEANLKYRHIQQDIMTLNQDNQNLQRNLKDCQAEKELLKREVQKYVNEVGRVEELLRSKDEERTELFEQFKSLSATTSSLEFQNNNLESQASNTKLELLAKHAELNHSKELISTLNQEIEEYISKHQNYELQLRNGTRELNELKMKYEENICVKDRLQRELTALRDLNLKISVDKDNIIKATRTKEKELTQLEVTLADLRQELDASKIQLSAEKMAVKSLEQLLAANRQKDYQTQLSNRELKDDLTILKDKLRQTETKLNALTDDISKYRGHSAELQVEVDSLKRQLTNAQFEREKLNQEIQKIRQSPRVVSPTYVVTTTVTETKTTNENPLGGSKPSNELVPKER